MGDRNDSRARLRHEPEQRGDAQEPELVVEGELVDDGAPEKEQEGPDWERVAGEYLDDLQRTRAEFDNFRKRVMRDQAEVNARAARTLVERLLPVLDNFDRAIAHGDASPGLTLVHRELVDVLAAEGLERLDPKGGPFDPQFHEAVESHEDAEVSEPTVTEVHRAGYLFKNKVLRPAMVAVARPPEPAPADGG